MKKLMLVSVCLFSLSACVQSPYQSGVWQDIQKSAVNVHKNEFGNDFDESLVKKIVKGKTTESQLVSMFGEPNFKMVINEKDTKWQYSHNVISVESPAYITGSIQDYQNSIKQNSTSKTLDILVRNGKVLNFALQKSDPSIKTKVESKIDIEKLQK
ncbi:hypothetical protein SAMN05660772_02725 [Pasteurella testudinis DSM 23072]|uniref:Beta-barrel assembly machine subunit BamE n=1 Tax=Pasteurella testudinis DSM 23072 TaxID=1122938 RepID=A0A1W1V1U2_9PAST|nr:hypothetical protein [Pasteurella testudinis]SMB87347.1 hypothetical protein SAMN05660772_02725 [Pasteurella testudinis DSM 23072]SUB51639.1 Uncharacterised protein [Pasteurella testudinis]